MNLKKLSSLDVEDVRALRDRLLAKALTPSRHTRLVRLLIGSGVFGAGLAAGVALGLLAPRLLAASPRLLRGQRERLEDEEPFTERTTLPEIQIEEAEVYLTP